MMGFNHLPTAGPEPTRIIGSLARDRIMIPAAPVRRQRRRASLGPKRRITSRSGLAAMLQARDRRQESLHWPGPWLGSAGGAARGAGAGVRRPARQAAEPGAAELTHADHGMVNFVLGLPIQYEAELGKH